VDGPLDVIKNCHCWRDRKMTGAPHDSCLLAAASAVHWLQGEALVVVYSLPEAPGFRTGFCRVCGTSLPAMMPHATTLGIPAGTVKSRTYYALRALRAAMVNQGLFSPV